MHGEAKSRRWDACFLVVFEASDFAGTLFFVVLGIKPAARVRTCGVFQASWFYWFRLIPIAEQHIRQTFCRQVNSNLTNKQWFWMYQIYLCTLQVKKHPKCMPLVLAHIRNRRSCDMQAFCTQYAFSIICLFVASSLGLPRKTKLTNIPKNLLA